MNSPLHPQCLSLRELTPQCELPLATEGVERFVWQSRFGSMLIEVMEGVAYINGERVEPAGPESPAHPQGASR